MAITTEYSTYNQIGQREDLSDVIYNVDYDETPMISRIGSASAKARLHEWQEDSYGDATTTTQLEGLVFAEDTPALTTRLSNACAIQKRNATVTGTGSAVDLAGRASEMAYQIVKKGVELRRDMEKTILNNTAKTTGATDAARTIGGLGTYVDTTDVVKLGASGVIGGGNGTATATDSAATEMVDFGNTAANEGYVKTVIKGIYNRGGMGAGTLIMCNATMKQLISGFTGRSQARQAIEAKSILAVADLYMSDFGDLQVVPNRLQRERDIWVADPKYLQIAYLRRMHTDDIAHTGDLDSKEVRVEYTLQVSAPSALGALFDSSTETS